MTKNTTADYRQKVLQTYNSHSVAIAAKNCWKKNVSNARVKGMEVIYNNKEKYYLLIEAADGTVYKKIEFTIDIALDF